MKSNKKLVFVIKAEQEYIRHTDSDEIKNASLINSLYNDISNIYIPLLSLAEKLESQNEGSNEKSLNAKFSLVLPPSLCALLTDSNIQNGYEAFLDKQIELGTKEIHRISALTQNSENNHDSFNRIIENISNVVEKDRACKMLFVQKYQKQLIQAFSQLHRSGVIELLATTGTEIYMPHYIDLKEIISAQIETGLHAFRQCFSFAPDGFYISALAYMPGIEKLIKAYGFTYTIVDSRAFLFSKNVPPQGIFYPALCENSLCVLASDGELQDKIFSENGYAANPVYKNENSDIAFFLPPKDLTPFLQTDEENQIRYKTGYAYKNKNYDLSDFDSYSEESVYDIMKAGHQIQKDADSFLKNCEERLTKALKFSSRNVTEEDGLSLTLVFNVCEICHKWSEGMLFLDKIISDSYKYNLESVSALSVEKSCKNMHKFTPYYSSSEGFGYGENLLSGKNSWMLRYTRKACERMIDLSDRFPTDTGLKTRLLNLGAKELLLSQSYSLAKMIYDGENTEYAEERFRECINSFTAMFDALGSHTVSTEWLTTVELRDFIFPWMNYKIFSKKK